MTVGGDIESIDFFDLPGAGGGTSSRKERPPARTHATRQRRRRRPQPQKPYDKTPTKEESNETKTGEGAEVPEKSPGEHPPVLHYDFKKNMAYTIPGEPGGRVYHDSHRDDGGTKQGDSIQPPSLVDEPGDTPPVVPEPEPSGTDESSERLERSTSSTDDTAWQIPGFSPPTLSKTSTRGWHEFWTLVRDLRFWERKGGDVHNLPHIACTTGMHRALWELASYLGGFVTEWEIGAMERIRRNRTATKTAEWYAGLSDRKKTAIDGYVDMALSNCIGRGLKYYTQAKRDPSTILLDAYALYTKRVPPNESFSHLLNHACRYN